MGRIALDVLCLCAPRQTFVVDIDQQRARRPARTERFRRRTWMENATVGWQGSSMHRKAVSEHIFWLHSLSSYGKFHSLNATDIGASYRALFGLYVSDKHSASKLNLEFDAVAARSGFEISQKMKWSVPRIDLLTDLTVTLKGRIPTLILHGFDDVIPSWTSEEISWAIADSKLVLFENCGHFPFVEAREEFTAQVNDFLDEHHL
mmetsp:Transcript_18222/g.25605  ORF Transcript_18222/g.25605 Transcript_18222/m.25605 type:complete len:205 (-) Transcript_18222:49-663(-)